jgi:hypothetical protein
MDRETADRLCPGAAEDRKYWQSGLERDAEAAAHTDNLLPVARASHSGMRRDAKLLREYAAALRGEGPRMLPDGWPDPASVGTQHIAAADLAAIAEHLEAGAERDWIAVIDTGPEREHLAGPLPPFPGRRPARMTGPAGPVMRRPGRSGSPRNTTGSRRTSGTPGCA